MKKKIFNKILAAGLTLVSLAICAAFVALVGFVTSIIVKLFLFGFNLI